MAIRIVKLGSQREPDEGVRIGTARRPPRGVPKTDYAKRDFYDVWLPILSPAPELLKMGKALMDIASWAVFKKRFHFEVNRGEPGKVLDLLAVLSHQTNMSLGFYCKREDTCHRSVLRELLMERGANLVQCDNTVHLF
jgi:uncharacterized protein YeaO (DUF488 family)